MIFTKNLFRHWVSFLSGGIGIVLITIYEHMSEKALPWEIFSFITLAVIIIASYYTWLDEHNKWEDENKRCIKLEEEAKPKLRLDYKGTMIRPEYQKENDLYRLAVINDSNVTVKGTRVVLESVESQSWNDFLPDHSLRVMEYKNSTFDISARSTVWVDVIEGIPINTGYAIDPIFIRPALTYAKGHRLIPPGNHVLTVRAEGSCLPYKAQITVNVTNENKFSVSNFKPLN